MYSSESQGQEEAGLSRKIVPPKIFILGQKFSEIMLKIFVLSSKFLSAWPGHVWQCFLGIFSAAGCMSMFSMLYNLFHHAPRMIFDPFL